MKPTLTITSLKLYKSNAIFFTKNKHNETYSFHLNIDVYCDNMIKLKRCIIKELRDRNQEYKFIVPHSIKY